MDIDGVKDIEVLRETLKAITCKCIKEFTLKDWEEIKTTQTKINEWYFYEYDRESYEYTIYDGNGNIGIIEEDILKEFFIIEENNSNGYWKIFNKKEGD